MKLCPPAKFPAVLGTMAPDLCDHSECPPEKIRLQWSHLLEYDPLWQSGQFLATARVPMYGQLKNYDIVVVTESEEPYGNLVLTVNPADSELLGSIPRIIESRLAGVLSQCGHSQRVVLVPGYDFPLGVGNDQKFLVESSTDGMLAVMSNLWIPDRHDQGEDSVLRSALGVCGDVGCYKGLAHEWLGLQFQQLCDEELTRIIGDWRTAAVLLCTNSGPSGNSYVMANGCTTGI